MGPGVAALHTVIHVLVERGTKTLVVQADKPESFLQIFLKRVQGFQVLGQSRHLAPARCPEEFLITTVDEQTDFVADYNSRFSYNRSFVAAIFDDSRAAQFGDLHARASPLDIESGLTDSVQKIAMARLIGFVVAEEHAVSSLYEEDFCQCGGGFGTMSSSTAIDALRSSLGVLHNSGHAGPLWTTPASRPIKGSGLYRLFFSSTPSV